MDGARHGRWLAAGLLAAIMVSVGVLATTSSGYVSLYQSHVIMSLPVFS